MQLISAINNNYQNILSGIVMLPFFVHENVLTKNQIIKKLTKNKFKNKCNILITDANEMFYRRKNEKMLLSRCSNNT